MTIVTCSRTSIRPSAFGFSKLFQLIPESLRDRLEIWSPGVPQHVHPVLLKGRVIDCGFLPDSIDPVEKIWIVRFDKHYPFVRVVQDINTQELNYMAADQVIVQVLEKD